MKWLARLLFGTDAIQGRERGAGQTGASRRLRRMAHPVLPGGIVVTQLDEYWRLDASDAGTADLVCSGCGATLGFDPEDEPDGEGQGLHICGACNRARNFDADLEYMATLE